MSEPNNTEPTDEQLANFISVYARRLPGAEHLRVSPTILEWMFEQNPAFRATALRHHRDFQAKIDEMAAKIMAGEAKCEYIRPSGKRCPNHNQPFSHYCGLHQDQEE